jgi:RNA polymerase sigma factor (sigma-70 family)
VNDEAELVARSLGGDKTAFGEIVERYKGLVSAICYNATGDLALSEDAAQEAFVSAWTNLAALRDRAKLRPWLSTIARNAALAARKKTGRDIVASADSIEAAAERPAETPSAAERTITKEEETTLWRALEGIPETYREPLVLYHRQAKSIAEVATALEISENAARQRLLRGRRLLRKELAAFVEETLSRSGPKAAFAIAVIAALPALAPQAAAAGIAATAAKTGASAAKPLAAGLSWLAPVALWLLAVAYSIDRIRRTESARERRFQLKVLLWHLTLVILAVSLFAAGIMTAMKPLGLVSLQLVLFGGMAVAVIFGFLAEEQGRQIRIEEETEEPPTGVRPLTAAQYMGLAGAVIFSFFWIVTMCYVAGEYVFGAAVLIVAAIVFVVGAWLLRTRPRLAAARYFLGLVFLVNLAAILLKWDLWMAVYRRSPWYDPSADVAAWKLAVFVVAFYTPLALLTWWVERRNRTR